MNRSQTRVIGIHDLLTYGGIINNMRPGQLLVLDFTASWCGPCRMIAPVVDQLSIQHPDVIFGKVDVDEVPELSTQFNVSAMPTFKFVRDNRVVSEFAGANRSLLQTTLQQLLYTPIPKEEDEEDEGEDPDMFDNY